MHFQELRRQVGVLGDYLQDPKVGMEAMQGGGREGTAPTLSIITALVAQG